MVPYRASLDVSRALAGYVSGLLAAERRRRGTRRGRRALTPFWQAVLVLRWFREDTRVARLANDAAIGLATAYRYLDEGIAVLAEQAPTLDEVLRQRREQGDTYVIVDGMLIRTDRLTERAETGIDRWYSGKHHAFGGNIQFLSSADGFPLWTADVEPGHTHDLTAAREQGAIGALCAAAAAGVPTLADKAYQAAGIGIHTPIKKPQGNQVLDSDNQCYNQLITRLRCLGERAAALITTRWKTLQRITQSPRRIGNIVKAALVLTQYEHQGRY